MHVVLMRHTQAGGYVTPFFVVGGICIIFAVPLFLLSSKVPCKYGIVLYVLGVIMGFIFVATEISRRVLPIKSLFRIMTNVIAAMLGNS